MKRENETKKELVKQNEGSCARKTHYWLQQASPPCAAEEMQCLENMFHSEQDAVNMLSIFTAKHC